MKIRPYYTCDHPRGDYYEELDAYYLEIENAKEAIE